MRPLSYLSDEKLDAFLSASLNCTMRLMQRNYGDHWRSLEWFVAWPVVRMLVDEYGQRHQRR